MTTPRAASPDAQLRELVAGQATSAARFDEVFRRLSTVEKTSEEARDMGREILTTLREQDSLAKIAEARGESTAQVAALRQDVVHANTATRAEVTAVGLRVSSLEALRDTGKGAVTGAYWLGRILGVLASAGAGAFALKFLEAMK